MTQTTNQAGPAAAEVEPLPGIRDPARLAALRATGLLEQGEVATFDQVTHLAARALRAPVAQVNLVTADAQIPRSVFAPLEPDPTRWHQSVTLASSFCKHVVSLGAALVVPDAREHPLVRHSPATTEGGIVAYASVPLRAPCGQPIGSVCVLDFEPRGWTDEDVVALETCAAIAAETVRARTTALAMSLGPTALDERATDERSAMADLERQNDELQAQGLELEMTNQRLLDNAAELEEQAAELQATSADLEERTTAAEDASAALVESEARARALAELLPVQVWTARPDGQLDYVSERTARYFGVSAERLLGVGWGDFAHPDDLPAATERWSRSIATGEDYEVEFRLRCAADGAYHWHLGRAVARRDGAGAVIAWIGSNTDIEAAKAATAAAEHARAAAEAANLAKGQFLSTMSHELRTPLNAIAGYTELLSLGIRGPVTAAQREDFGRIRRANQHLMGLITDILNFARLDAGRVEMHVEDVPVGPLVADLESLVGPQLAAKRLAYDHDSCASDTPDRPHTVRADPERLRQVLLNLLSNAIKFTPPGGRVSLACEDDRAASVVRVRVVDTGRGIAADELHRIFEPFVQIDRHSTHESQQGVGLGLAISRDLARAMGGELTVESTPGAGSVFTVTLARSERAGRE